MNLAGKKVIVTGGVRGLGRAVVERLLASEAQVSVFDLDETALSVLAAEKSVHCVRCDVSDYEQVAKVTAAYHEEFGAADVLINNAGILYSAPLLRLGPAGLEKHDVADWNKVIGADLSSVFYMTLCVAEKMVSTRTKGVVVNISSVSAGGNAGQSAYSAAKAGVNALTATWAKELSPMGIRVVAVAPGYSETESTKQALNEGVLREIVKRVPSRRLGQPSEIADGVLWAITNDFFNGKVLELDGGLIV